VVGNVRMSLTSVLVKPKLPAPINVILATCLSLLSPQRPQ
jgi:hypothetical protein